ncbi:AraC family transcriptional regulator [Aliamphritea ceti]|uniref:AraC family transcriptional regulator n=1 Tax=Aliamphritea ceti TaxID=1524258 RepID=UPI0021C3BBD5|nr:AraC family transcriptional regulator [Aliamphritea ceti]
MATIFEHTQTNILVIPQALFAMQDVTIINQDQHSVIFYKALQNDLTNIEFYTNSPCFIYIDSGREVITNSANESIELLPGDSVFIPQGLNLHSDFVKQTESLSAYLVFFSDQTITDFLARIKQLPDADTAPAEPHLLPKNPDLRSFFTSVSRDIQDPGYLATKLHELLFLIANESAKQKLYKCLLNIKTKLPKRNLARLLEQHDIIQLSVTDLANISGRSISSFNRDFKNIYEMSPKQWLQEKRLCHAKTLLEEQNISVTETAMAVGYENVSNFIRAFKIKYGVTPKQIKLSK